LSRIGILATKEVCHQTIPASFADRLGAQARGEWQQQAKKKQLLSTAIALLAGMQTAPARHGKGNASHCSTESHDLLMQIQQYANGAMNGAGFPLRVSGMTP